MHGIIRLAVLLGLVVGSLGLWNLSSPPTLADDSPAVADQSDQPEQPPAAESDDSEADAAGVASEPTTQPADDDSDAPSTTQPSSPPATQPSSAEVQQELSEMIAPNPVFEPTDQPPAQPQVDPTPPTVVSVDIDPSVLGLPPGAQQPTLRREGEFIVNRRGRIMRSPNGGHVLFIFESDSEASQETPMPLVPCQILQNMEDLSQGRGGKIVFIVSGQVMLYRGVNFLLPTMMKLAVERGNLQE